jgi:2-methylcitrate dehydratase PrpD
MNTTPEIMPIEALCDNILETCFENFDGTTVKNAKLRILDVLGCAIGGAEGSGNRGLVDLVRSWGGSEEATVYVYGGKAPAQNAAMVNSIMGRSFDFEVMSPLIDGVTIPAHISGTTVMTALAVGEKNRVNGRSLITALLVGEDMASRVLAASGPGFTLGWDSVGTVNALGATAIAGRLQGLDRVQMRNAFGLALNQLAGSFQSIWDGTTAFKLHQGTSARNGIFSAELAGKGWTGPRDPLLSRFGYFPLYTDGGAGLEILTKDLGRKYYAEATFKAYPCCRATHGVIDCILDIVGREQIRAENVEKVILYLPRSGLDNFVGQPFRIRDFPQGDAVFSYRYTAALGVMWGSVKLKHFSEESVRDPRVAALIERISLAELPGGKGLQCQVHVQMKDGRKFSASTDAPKGDPVGNPMSEEEIMAKFMENVAFSGKISREKGERVMEAVNGLESLDDVSRLSGFLVP